MNVFFLLFGFFSFSVSVRWLRAWLWLSSSSSLLSSLLTQSLTPSLSQSVIHSVIHPFVHSFTHSFVHSLVCFPPLWCRLSWSSWSWSSLLIMVITSLQFPNRKKPPFQFSVCFLSSLLLLWLLDFVSFVSSFVHCFTVHCSLVLSLTLSHSLSLLHGMDFQFGASHIKCYYTLLKVNTIFPSLSLSMSLGVVWCGMRSNNSIKQKLVSVTAKQRFKTL